jgi:hypothetical protein
MQCPVRPREAKENERYRKVSKKLSMRPHLRCEAGGDAVTKTKFVEAGGIAEA